MIGILAGMGPKSTGPFIDQVVFAFQGMTKAVNDIDFPPMMIYSLPTPFYVDRPVDHSLMEKTICAGLEKLESCGVYFIAMPCSTAHVYFSKLEKCLRIPLLNMVQITLDSLPKTAQKITILGTRSTIECGVYQKGVEQRGAELILEPNWQKRVDQLILSAKSSHFPKQAVTLWEDLSVELQRAGIDTAILACTDLSGIIRSVQPPFKVIDASDCLAKAVVRKWRASCING